MSTAEYVIDCSSPVSDKFFELQDLVEYLEKKMKVNGLRNNLAGKVEIEKKDDEKTVLVKASVKYGKVVRVGWQKIGKKVTLTAKPKRGCRLIGWYDAKGKLVSKKVNYKVKVEKATKYAARFGKK